MNEITITNETNETIRFGRLEINLASFHDILSVSKYY